MRNNRWIVFVLALMVLLFLLLACDDDAVSKGTVTSKWQSGDKYYVSISFTSISQTASCEVSKSAYGRLNIGDSYSCSVIVIGND
jgi:hypothetical protein